MAVHMPVLASVVGNQMGFRSDVLAQNRGQGGHGDLVHDHGAGAARGAIHQRENLHLVVVAAALDLSAGLAADEGFVALDNAALAAERGKVAGAHGFPDTVRQKPSGFVLDL